MVTTTSSEGMGPKKVGYPPASIRKKFLINKDGLGSVSTQGRR